MRPLSDIAPELPLMNPFRGKNVLRHSLETARDLVYISRP